MTTLLPKAFETLTPFLAWAQPTQDGRQQMRINASTGELRAFYDAALPLLPRILTYVDQFPLGQLPEEARPVYWMALSLAEVAPHVELYKGDPRVPFSFDEARFVAEHGKEAA
ncbi:hypothetical protein [Zavarzinia aquatilis]|uniref:Uncharacterized protein n=1 Tax=Zavarzinia aquatilis TaxID=2211142 RepID=A0A317E345_9PROT|nr:hypothetical protein [Zavarzinia aquatilis]PWR19515.1 hypothetical protein DKG74_17140 [Zavarzinia aquatilis]